MRSKYYDIHTLHDVYMHAVHDVSLRKDVFALTRIFLRDMNDALEGTGTPNIPGVPLLFHRVVPPREWQAISEGARRVVSHVGSHRNEKKQRQLATNEFVSTVREFLSETTPEANLLCDGLTKIGIESVYILLLSPGPLLSRPRNAIEAVERMMCSVVIAPAWIQFYIDSGELSFNAPQSDNSTIEHRATWPQNSVVFYINPTGISWTPDHNPSLASVDDLSIAAAQSQLEKAYHLTLSDPDSIKKLVDFWGSFISTDSEGNDVNSPPGPHDLTGYFGWSPPLPES